MGAHKDRADWLDSTIGTAMSITCIKAFPGWDRPAHPTSKYGAILWARNLPSERRRIGQDFTRHNSEFTIYIVAGDEIELWDMLDDAQTMSQDYQVATITSLRHVISWGAWERTEFPQEATEHLRYSAQCPVVISQDRS